MARRRSRGRRRGRRNPSFGEFKSMLPTAGWAIVGGVGARSIPEMVAKNSNQGWMGYAMNAGTAIGLSWLLGRFVSKTAGDGAFLGGVVMTVGRVVEEQFGKKLVEFSAALGLGGDPGYDLGGYDTASFPLPTTSYALPAVAAAAAGQGNRAFANPFVA